MFVNTHFFSCCYANRGINERVFYFGEILSKYSFKCMLLLNTVKCLLIWIGYFEMINPCFGYKQGRSTKDLRTGRNALLFCMLQFAFVSRGNLFSVIM